GGTGQGLLHREPGRGIAFHVVLPRMYLSHKLTSVSNDARTSLFKTSSVVKKRKPSLDGSVNFVKETPMPDASGQRALPRLGAKVRALRRQAGLSQVQMAERLAI